MYLIINILNDIEYTQKIFSYLIYLNPNYIIIYCVFNYNYTKIFI